MKQPFAFLRKDETGSISVETVIIFPLLLWAFGAMFVFWDAFKVQNLNIKATYTIADLVSREPDPVDANYIDGLNTVYGFLLNPATGERDNDIRISVVSNTLDPDTGNEEIELQWSCATGDKKAYLNADPLIDQLPIMAVNDQLIVVESTMEWAPPIRVGLTAGTRRHRIFTSPRFVPQVLLNGSC